MPTKTGSSADTHVLRIDGQPESLARIGDWIMEAAQACGLDEDEAFKVQLAVDEACTNVIEHAYEGRGGTIELCCCREGTGIRVRIQDWGQSFDLDAVRQPDLYAPLKDRQVGGLGLHFMRSLMDQVRFSFDQDEGNVLTMVKTCSGKHFPDGEETPA